MNMVMDRQAKRMLELCDTHKVDLHQLQANYEANEVKEVKEDNSSYLCIERLKDEHRKEIDALHREYVRPMGNLRHMHE